MKLGDLLHTKEHRSASENSQTGAPAVQTGLTSNGGCFQKRLSPQRQLYVGANICTATVQGGYLQSYASTRQRGETILPPVMPAPMTMKCQSRAVPRTRGVAGGIPPTVDLAANLSHRHCGRQKINPLRLHSPSG